MPYTSPATVVSGTTIATAWGNSVKAGTDYLANPPACRVYHNTTQSVGSGGSLALAFNTELYDTDTMHDTVTNNSRITAKTAGIYLLNAAVQVAAAADYTIFETYFRVNNATVVAVNSMGTWADATDGPLLSNTATFKLAVNDYVEVVVFQKNGAAAARSIQAANATTNHFKASAAATWIGLG